jgi:hypothetical protein
MRDGRQQPLIGALRPVGRRLVLEIAPHPVDMLVRPRCRSSCRTAGEAGMGEPGCAAVRIIVADILPVDGARPQRRRPKRLAGRRSGKARSSLHRAPSSRHRRARHRSSRTKMKPCQISSSTGEPSLRPCRAWDSWLCHGTPVSGHRFIGPGVIRADQLFRAAAGAIDQRAARWRQTLVKARN